MYAAFANTTMDDLKATIQSLREVKFLSPVDPERYKKLMSSVVKGRQLEWASVMTRDGSRRVARLEEDELVDKLMKPGVFDVLDRLVFKDGEAVTKSRKKIFIVHGRDLSMLRDIESFIRRIGLEPIVLMDGASRGRTVIEKFEDESDVGFAIVLLSPDDTGKAYESPPASQKRRPRQNAIFELGYFIARLGRENVVVMVDETLDAETEYPSDIQGYITIHYRPTSDWKTLLQREFNEAGLEYDHTRV